MAPKMVKMEMEMAMVTVHPAMGREVPGMDPVLVLLVEIPA